MTRGRPLLADAYPARGPRHRRRRFRAAALARNELELAFVTRCLDDEFGASRPHDVAVAAGKVVGRPALYGCDIRELAVVAGLGERFAAIVDVLLRNAIAVRRDQRNLAGAHDGHRRIPLPGLHRRRSERGPGGEQRQCGRLCHHRTTPSPPTPGGPPRTSASSSRLNTKPSTIPQTTTTITKPTAFSCVHFRRTGAPRENVEHEQIQAR